MKQTIVRATVLSAFALLFVGGGVLAWHLRERTRDFYTDAGAIRMPAAGAPLRDIVWQPATPIAATVNTEVDEYEPRVTQAGGTLFFVRGRAAANADIFTSERTGAGWGEPVSLNGVNQHSDELGPEPSPDGQVLYFYSNRAGGHGGYDLWSVRRTAEGWDEPRNLGPEVNTEHNEYGPALAPDGMTLYFASDRPAPPLPPEDLTGPPADADPTVPPAPRGGGYDIYATTITTAGPIGVEPVMALNTPFNDGAPAFTPQGDFVYFASDRPGGYGGFDVYRARRTGAGSVELGAPERLDAAVNTAADELDPSIGLGGFELIFSSNRLVDGVRGDYNVFVALSKEVFADSETYRAEIDWATFLSTIGPLLLYLLVMAIGIFALMKIQTRHKRLTLIARCLLGSVLAHVMLLLGMSAWTVTTSLVGALREGGGTKVVLESSAVGRDLSGQLRGGLVEVTSSSPSTPPTERARTTVTNAQPASQHTQAVAHAVLEHQTTFEPPTTSDASAAPARMPTQQHQTPPTRYAERLPVALPAAPVQVTAVESSVATPTSPIAERPAEDASPRDVPTDSTPPATAVATAVAPSDLTTHHNSRTRFVRPPSPREATIPDRETPPQPPVHLATNVTADRGLRLPSGSDQPRPAMHVETGVQVTALAGTSEPQSRTTVATPSSFEATHVQTAPTAATATPDTPSFAVAHASGAPTPPPTELTPRLADATAVATPITPTLALPGGGSTRTTAREEAAPAEASSITTPTDQDRQRVAVARDANESETRVDVTPSTAATARPSSLLGSLPPSTIDLDPIAQFAVAGQSGNDLPGLAHATTARAPRLMVANTTTDEPELPSDLADGLPAAPRGRLDEMALRHGERLDEGTIELARPAPLEPPSVLASLVDMRSEEASPEPLQVIAKAERPQLDFRPLIGPELLDFRKSLPETKVPREMQYVQRSEDHRRERITEMGGSPATERAVAMSLAWLARHQSADGHWDGKQFDEHCGRCAGPASVDSNVALTGLTLLAFMTANHTHINSGPYRHPIDRALEWLVAQQNSDGGWIGRESMYSQGIATMAIAEAYGMTGDPDLQEPLEKAVQFIFDSRNRAFGGWRYKPGQIGDTSVLGWQVMALTSARRAGVAVPEEAFDVARRWLPKVRDPSNPGLYAYQPTQNPTPAMTAEALMIHQMLGAGRDEPHMQDSAEYVIRFLPRWKQNTTYFWYYATLALFQHGGFEWERWNEAMREQLLTNQHTEGDSAGSWDPEDKWATAGGRVYQTAICTLTLEVYYRYLPLYVRERISRR